MKGSLYELFKMNRKHSLLKSVFYEKEGVYSIEAYDDTLLNVINGGRDRFIKAEKYIEKMICKHMRDNNVTTARVVNYSMYNYTFEYIIKISKKGLTYY